MNNNESIENILLDLIKGVDPRTGFPIREGSPILDHNIKEALNNALEAVKNYKAYKLNKMNLPANTGKPWLKEDDQKLSINFDQGMKVEQLAKIFQRTRGAIHARLIRLGKIDDVPLLKP